MPFKTNEELEEIKQKIYQEAWPMIADVDNEQWSLKNGNCAEKTGLIFKQDHPKFGTVWKLQVEIDISADEYYQRFVERDDDIFAPKVEVFRILERGHLGEWRWIVNYLKSEKIGAVASRDFVNISFYKRLNDGSYIMLSQAVDYPDSPKLDKNCVRGQTLPHGNILRPVSGKPRKCECHFIDNKDLKGFLPKYLVNLATSTFGLEFATAAIKKAKSLKNSKKLCNKSGNSSMIECF